MYDTSWIRILLISLLSIKMFVDLNIVYKICRELQ